MREMWLSGNSWVVKREGIVDDEGNPPSSALTARVFLSTTEDGNAIDPELEVQDVAMTGQKIRVVLGGPTVQLHLEPLLNAADAAGQPLDVYDRVVVPGSYNDFERIRVTRYRPAGIT